jgi:hypothetical protein
MKPEKCALNLENRTIAHSLHHVEHSEDWKNMSGSRVEVPDKRGPCETMNGRRMDSGCFFDKFADVPRDRKHETPVTHTLSGLETTRGTCW